MATTNPFMDYYRTELVADSKRFARLFEPILVKKVSPLFRPGNVVLKGTPGTGKTMLLHLFRSDVRLAYLEIGDDFPIPDESRKFVSAGINLNLCGAWDFGQRTDDSTPDREKKVPYYFADYLNYSLASDLISNITTLTESKDEIAHQAGISTEAFRSEQFVKRLVNHDCWFGALKDVDTLEQLQLELDRRLQTYKAYLNFNIPNIPSNVDQSKTEIGKPLETLVSILKESGCLYSETNVFMHIDQYEDLFHIQEGSDNNFNKDYREMINKILAHRGSLVSYRIGTRSYAWDDENLKIFGSSATLEAERTHTILDLNQELRRHEDSSSWVFPEMMEKVFLRRLLEADDMLIDKEPDKLVRRFFGRSLSHEKKAKYYAGSNPLRALRFEKEWPDSFVQDLKQLNSEDPFNAKLLESWVRQEADYKKESLHSYHFGDAMPWKDKQYWLKERKPQALKQISNRCGQREFWSGYEDIRTLSGSNISVFLKICKFIWDEIPDGDILDSIPEKIQNIAIHKASVHSFTKISSEFKGEFKMKFITSAAHFLEKKLYNDKAMSYPGQMGFSVKTDDLISNRDVKAALEDLVGSGELVERKHTTKSSDRRSRKKYHFQAILCPYLKIPPSNTKEPYYAPMRELKKWVGDESQPAESNDPSKTFQKELGLDDA